jgi:hypothetical protein
MTEYLPLTGETGAQRSRLEGQQRAAGLQLGDVTQYWHSWIVHPLTGQEALVVNNAADKEYFSAPEIAALLSEAQAETDDWFLEFEPEVT